MEPPIRTVGLTKRFGHVTALDDLSLEVEPGEVFGYLGPNGAGKSTTLRLLLAFVRPTAGSAWLCGIDVRDVEAAHRKVAYVPGEVSLWPKLTGAECLELCARLRGGVDTVYRDELVRRFELDTSKRARAYSKGNRQKVALIAALATRADVLLFDEPTSGLDPLMEEQFRECVKEATGRGQTIFLSSHILSEVEQLCGRVGILRNGRLVETAEVDRLRAMHQGTIEVDFDGDVPALDGVEGVAAVSPTPTGLSITLNGPPAPVLAVLSGLDLTGIRSREASLESVFLDYYGHDAGAPVDAPT